MPFKKYTNYSSYKIVTAIDKQNANLRTSCYTPTLTQTNRPVQTSSELFDAITLITVTFLIKRGRKEH